MKKQKKKSNFRELKSEHNARAAMRANKTRWETSKVNNKFREVNLTNKKREWDCLLIWWEWKSELKRESASEMQSKTTI